jgi:hypothetical protein
LEACAYKEQVQDQYHLLDQRDGQDVPEVQSIVPSFLL